jgi:hypothetical protein
MLPLSQHSTLAGGYGSSNSPSSRFQAQHPRKCTIHQTTLNANLLPRSTARNTRHNLRTCPHLPDRLYNASPRQKLTLSSILHSHRRRTQLGSRFKQNYPIKQQCPLTIPPTDLRTDLCRDRRLVLDQQHLPLP